MPDLATPAERDAWLKAHPMTVMAMPESDWKAWTDKPADAAVLLTSWMVHKPYVVVAVNAGAQTSDEASPADGTAAAESSEAPAEAPAASASPTTEPAATPAAEPAAEEAPEASSAPAPAAPAEPAQTPAGSADSAARS